MLKLAVKAVSMTLFMGALILVSGADGENGYMLAVAGVACMAVSSIFANLTWRGDEREE